MAKLCLVVISTPRHGAQFSRTNLPTRVACLCQSLRCCYREVSCAHQPGDGKKLKLQQGVFI